MRAFWMVTRNLENILGELEIKGKRETIQIIVYISARILRKVLKMWRVPIIQTEWPIMKNKDWNNNKEFFQNVKSSYHSDWMTNNEKQGLK